MSKVLSTGYITHEQLEVELDGIRTNTDMLNAEVVFTTITKTNTDPYNYAKSKYIITWNVRLMKQFKT